MVINTVGPFTTTALEIINACSAAGSHYIDLANDVAAVSAAYEMRDAATQAGHTLVTGAGFGVTATESVVVKLCADPPVRREVVLGVDTHGRFTSPPWSPRWGRCWTQSPSRPLATVGCSCEPDRRFGAMRPRLP
ncbi:hypothetical protein SUDANB150_01448 [Streptomyces sp. enrichment culture]